MEESLRVKGLGPLAAPGQGRSVVGLGGIYQVKLLDVRVGVQLVLKLRWIDRPLSGHLLEGSRLGDVVAEMLNGEDLEVRLGQRIQDEPVFVLGHPVSLARVAQAEGRNVVFEQAVERSRQAMPSVALVGPCTTSFEDPTSLRR
jgi:hypothetical protein